MYRNLLLALSLLMSCGVKNVDDEMVDEDIQRQDDGVADEGEDHSQLRPVRRDLPADAEALVEDPASPTRHQDAIDALVAMGDEALPTLGAASARGGEIAVRGRAILALGQIPGAGADGILLAIQDDSEDEQLVRTWAAAARVSRATTLDDVLGFAPLLSSFPALERPLKLKVEATAGALDDVGGALRMIEADQTLGAVLGDAVMAAGAGPLVKAMFKGSTQRVRQLAAGFLATLIQQDASAADLVAAAYVFDLKADAVPWSGGPLYVPSSSWRGDQARTIVGGLVSWYVFADKAGDQEAKTQIYNNLQFVGLIRPAGLQWAPNDPVELLKAWGQAVGPEAIEKILAEQGLKRDSRYSAVLEGLR